MVVISRIRLTLPDTNAPKVDPSIAAPVTASAIEKCVESVTVIVNTRFCSNGLWAPSDLNAMELPVVQPCAVVVCTTAGLADEIASTTCASLVITKAGPVVKRRKPSVNSIW